MNSDKYAAEFDFAINTARAAGDMIRTDFDKIFDIEIKSDDSPVTVTDKNVNQLVIDGVHEAFPGDSILAEEGSDETPSDRVWVCDPIDGTSGFSIGCPTGLFSLAFVVDGSPEVAVVCDPYLNRLYTSVKGGGSFMNGQKLSVGSGGVDGARIGISSSPYEFTAIKDYYDEAKSKGMRHYMYSGVVHQWMNVALGKLDARVYNGPHSHDAAASTLIISEAGGKVTDRDGNELRLDGKINGAVMSNGVVHDQLLQMVKQFDIASKTVRSKKV